MGGLDVRGLGVGALLAVLSGCTFPQDRPPGDAEPASVVAVDADGSGGSHDAAVDSAGAVGGQGPGPDAGREPADGPVPPPDTAGSTAIDAAPDRPPPAPTGSAGSKVLYVAGPMPLVGIDGQIHEALRAKSLVVEDVVDSAATAASAQGMQLVLISYSVNFTQLRAEPFADLPVPIVVLEHAVLPALGMTAADGHGFAGGATRIIISDAGSPLSGGLGTGGFAVYLTPGEFPWGTPGPGAIKIAALEANPDRWVTFGYSRGAMMADRPAPARRLLLFASAHSPPADPTPYLNTTGIRLLAAAIDWSLEP